MGSIGGHLGCQRRDNPQRAIADAALEHDELLDDGGSKVNMRIDVTRLQDFLIGVGDVLTAFGTAPTYDVPRVGDRARDLEHIHADARRVGKDLNKTTEKALRGEHGEIDDRATQRTRSTRHRVATRN